MSDTNIEMPLNSKDNEGNTAPNGLSGKKYVGCFQRSWKHRLTSDELRVIRQCESEAFYLRALPMAFCLGLATYAGIRAGYFKPNSRFGSIPKVMLSIFAGYILGKATYHCTYTKKVIQIPNSNLAEEWRLRSEKFGGNFCKTMMNSPIFYTGLIDEEKTFESDQKSKAEQKDD